MRHPFPPGLSLTEEMGLPALRAALATIVLLWWMGASAEHGAPREILVRGQPIKYPLFSIFAARGEAIELELPGPESESSRLLLDGEPLRRTDSRSWHFTAPRSTGLYRLSLERSGTGGAVELNLFVGSPVEEIRDGQLNGYRIGPLPPSHKKYPSLYRAPEVYFEVTEDNIDTKLSPHFTLRQFLCKQESHFPKYVVVRESLLLLLEGLVDAIRESGYPLDTLGVISGYRTPWYNESIGNVSNSRHVYGDAFDFFVDVDGDGKMDDLNRNGHHDRGDVDLLAAIADEFMRRPENAQIMGGMGRYYKTSRHGGFVHVDTRGFAARW